MAEKYDPRKTPKYVLITLVITAAALLAVALVYRRAEGYAASAREHLAAGREAEAAADYERAIRHFPFKADYYRGQYLSWKRKQPRIPLP